MDLEQFYLRAKTAVKSYLDLNRDKISNEQTVDAIRSGIEFRGTNLWVLIFAIFVASLGLNMNSTPVIIGAMLISPLMGPIQGIGLGLGIIDLDLIKRSLKNLGVATLGGMLTSCLYFLLSPIDDACSELLARTQPTIYDVLIAFFGGMAGIIATGSKDKGNVIPGVAIATALMPPLCTSGYGLATGQWSFFFGAFYLYLINCVYIGFATWLGVRILKLPRKPVEDQRRRRNLVRGIGIFVLVTALPSLYITYRILRQNIVDTQVNNFVAEQFNFPSTQVLNKQLITRDGKRTLEVSLIGQSVPQDSINMVMARMPFYGLKDVGLRVVQGYEPGATTDTQTLTASIVQDLLKHNQQQLDRQDRVIDSLRTDLLSYQRLDSIGITIAPEVKVIFPQVSDIAVANTYVSRIDSSKLAPVTIAIVATKQTLSSAEEKKLREWLSARIQTKNLELIMQSARR